MIIILEAEEIKDALMLLAEETHGDLPEIKESELRPIKKLLAREILTHFVLKREARFELDDLLEKITKELEVYNRNSSDFVGLLVLSKKTIVMEIKS